MDTIFYLFISKKGFTILLNLKITISYDGSRFMGSAIQPHLYTVQGELESVLKKLGIKEKTVFSGRTDKNVHATRQVVSVRVPLFWKDIKRLKTTLENMLQPFIKIVSIKQVHDDFHARFSAKKREYRYIISTKPLNPFLQSYCHYERHLDINKLKSASQYLLGTHDFKNFSKTGSDPKSTIRTIYKIDIYQYKDYIILKFNANAYLRSQIRKMVAFLLKISQGKLTTQELQTQLKEDIIISNDLAPASGLYLSKIIY